jgi:4-hydroxythreonine-4-phosphate dehydrogenase
MTSKCRRIALTSGEPAGIGPDLSLQISQHPCASQIITIGDPEVLRARAELLGIAVRLEDFDPARPARPSPPGTLCVLPVSTRNPVIAGRLDVANADYVLKTLNAAIQGCQQGLFAAMVTAPLHKGIINDAGIAFSGHTEYLQQSCHSEQTVMMLCSRDLRVALVTTHLPLAEVSGQISRELLSRIITVLHADLGKYFALKSPRILVCGLNPHAGEGGHLGREELDTIIPVLEHFRQQGMQLIGPLPADTAFTPEQLKQADVVLSMYHDQGLPVLKAQGFGEAVNITLGLPIVRTSVDHGTALELAGSGRASAGSLMTALRYAEKMAEAAYSLQNGNRV